MRIEELIGNTPLVEYRGLGLKQGVRILGKLEGQNPGGSVKDRAAFGMIKGAMDRGDIKKGDKLVEATSGNTGIALAMIASIMGVKMTLIMPDNSTRERVLSMEAYGAKVILTPAKQTIEYSRTLADEMAANEGYHLLNHCGNTDNYGQHYRSTGPEIWKQTEGKITHFVSGVGTGGTISGVGKYLKEQNPNIKLWGIDTYGSVFKKYHETGIFDENEIYPYVTEGIGEDILPKNVNFDVIDGFTKVTDKDAAIYTQKLAKEEGMFLGNSAGAAIKGLLQLKEHFSKDDVVVVLFHDHGSRYVGKMFNDDWMKEKGFIES